MLRIKNIVKWATYNRDDCVAARCLSESAILLSTGALAPVDVGLCEKHWLVHCEDTEDIIDE